MAASKFLIVICSKNTPGSRWVDEEIKQFRKLGRNDNIITLLVDGEPHEAFPEEFMVSEPSAADVRPRSDKKADQIKHIAKLRLISGILGVEFDTLMQREQRRIKLRRLLTSLIVIGLAIATSLGTLGAEDG